jgi:hypothetical protein
MVCRDFGGGRSGWEAEGVQNHCEKAGPDWPIRAQEKLGYLSKYLSKYLGFGWDF